MLTEDIDAALDEVRLAWCTHAFAFKLGMQCFVVHDVTLLLLNLCAVIRRKASLQTRSKSMSSAVNSRPWRREPLLHICLAVPLSHKPFLQHQLITAAVTLNLWYVVQVPLCCHHAAANQISTDTCVLFRMGSIFQPVHRPRTCMFVLLLVVNSEAACAGATGVFLGAGSLSTPVRI